jgi:chemotaxis protein MotB
MREQNQKKESASSAEREFVIIKKIKKGHSGHHGGAWKVAYADFVTTMMALFIVLWIVGQSKEIKQYVGEYFRDPGAFSKYTKRDIFTESMPISPDALRIKGVRTRMEETAGLHRPPPPLQTQKQSLEQVEKTLQKKLATAPEFARLKDQIEVTITDEGMLVELLEKDNSSFFELGSARLNSSAIAVLREVTGAIHDLSNPVVIAGHTDSRPFSSLSGYSNWELSTDRANSARQVMENFGLSSDRIVQLRGYADRQLRYPNDPYDVRNRRVSIMVLYERELNQQPDQSEEESE